MYFFDDNLLLNHNNTTKTMSFPNKSSWLIREKKVVFTRRASEIELRLGLEAQCLKPSPRAAWGGTGASLQLPLGTKETALGSPCCTTAAPGRNLCCHLLWEIEFYPEPPSWNHSLLTWRVPWQRVVGWTYVPFLSGTLAIYLHWCLRDS